MGRAGRLGGADAGPIAAVSSEHGVHLVAAGEAVTFGRDRTAAVRIGAWPVRDPGVPRCAGRVAIDADGIVVENLADRPLRVVAEGRESEVVPPAGRSRPGIRCCAVLLDGEVATYELLACIADGDGLRLRDAQRQLLDAFADPVEHGELVPTHEQVAAALGLPASSVRARCHELRGKLDLAGIEVRALGDVREEIVDAWTRLRR